ncbi:MAG: glycosyltransferase, partial [Planctomycetia bacterium]
CLDALACQTYSADRFEVIVVDNASEQTLEPAIAGRPNVTLAFEAQKGSYAARNRALTLARGAVLAFTDSDCIPTETWLMNGVTRLLADDGLGIVAGNVTLFFHDPAKPTPTELYELVWAFPQELYVTKHHYGVTANLFTRRSVIDHVGPFDGRMRSSGDHDWGNRVHHAGYRLTYAPDAVVRHPARKSFRDMQKKIIRTTGGNRDLLFKEGRYKPFRYFLSAIVDMLAPYRLVARVCSDAKLTTNWQRLQVLAVTLGIRWTRATTKLKLMAFDKPRTQGANPGGTEAVKPPAQRRAA